MNDLVWIAVPHRLVEEAPPLRRPAVIRIAVVPRLDGPDLAFHGLDDWPGMLTDALDFQLYVKTGDSTFRTRIPPVLLEPVARRDVWRAVFREDSARIFLTGRRGWQDRPRVTKQYDHARKIGHDYREAGEILAEPREPDQQVAAGYISQWPTPPPEPRAPAPSPLEPGLDFRRTFGLLREHPEVLRDLGLVFELLVEADELNAGDAPERYLSVRSGALGRFVTSPWTCYQLNDDGFWPGSDPRRSAGVGRGIIDLSGVRRVDLIDGEAPPWAIATFDVDGGVNALRAAERLLAQDRRQETQDRRQETSMPSLRSAGLMLIRPGREQELQEHLEVSVARAAGDAAKQHLYADDLVLGYRIDVLESEDGTWRPLCDRETEYWVIDAEGRRIDIAAGRDGREEGHVKHNAAIRTEDGVVRPDEVVVRWDGWSLAVPPPRLLLDGLDPFPGLPARSASYDLRWRFRVPQGTLPRLRFGRAYRLRVRVADITGGGPGMAALDVEKGASDEVAYRRHEPVLPPRLHLEAAALPGAAVDRLVIRSDRDMSVAAFAEANPHYAAPDRCSLHPPTAPFTLVEQHGTLDSLNDGASWALAKDALQVMPGDPPERSLPDPAASGVAAYVAPAPGGVDEALWEAVSWGDWPSRQTLTVRVDESRDGRSPISLRWDRDTLRIGLGQAEEAEVELSSTIRDELLRHFAVYEWVAESSQPEDDLHRGRHPMLSPPARVHAVHAVRRPLRDPVWRDPDVERDENDATAVVSARFGDGGLDTDSTGRLEVAASWEEWDDDVAPVPPVPAKVDHVYGEDVARGAAPRLSFTHDFGDTKHREVTYSLKAVSRFRRYFEPGEPESAFVADAPQPPLIVPSSARPPDLEVLGVVPGFRWSTEEDGDRIVRRRSGNRLVVELARPWYVTGAGERLAVIAAAGPPREQLADVVTQMARDPVYDSPPIGRFPGAGWFEGEAASLELPDAGPVSVISHPVDLSGERWRADVGMAVPEDDSSYRPFVRLAVARYQPHSLEGLELSSIATTAYVPLMPHREIVVERAGGELRVHVRGIAPEPSNKVIAGLDEAVHAATDQEAGDLIALDGRAGNGDALPAWRPLPVETRPGRVSGPPIVIRLPPVDRPLRLRIREVEDLPGIGDGPAEFRERTVLVDHIPIPGRWHRP